VVVQGELAFALRLLALTNSLVVVVVVVHMPMAQITVSR
jgi:hypothetical protein